MLEPVPGPGASLPEAAYQNPWIAALALVIPGLGIWATAYYGSRKQAQNSPERPANTEPGSGARPGAVAGAPTAQDVLQRMLDKVQEQLDQQERDHRQAMKEAQVEHRAAMEALGKRYDRLSEQFSEERTRSARLEVQVQHLTEQVAMLRGRRMGDQP